MGIGKKVKKFIFFMSIIFASQIVDHCAEKFYAIAANLYLKKEAENGHDVSQVYRCFFNDACHEKYSTGLSKEQEETVIEIAPVLRYMKIFVGIIKWLLMSFIAAISVLFFHRIFGSKKEG